MSATRESILQSLDEKGYAVVPDVLSVEECNQYSYQFLSWYKSFGDEPPVNHSSIIHQYRVMHLDAAWRVRLKAKSVFSLIWGTDKLLSSTDGIAIGEPPELGQSEFDDGEVWFHLDHARDRRGAHIFQGAVYLEQVSDDDHCLRVIEGTHKFHEEFLETFPDACAMDPDGHEHFRLKSEWIDWFKKKGCYPKKTEVPKGGIVLWDSRIVHDTVQPTRGRKNPSRWRYVVFVSMAPAIWANEEDYKLKAEAYDTMVGTGCSSARRIKLFQSSVDCEWTKDKKIMEAVEKVPPIGKTREAKLMVGIERYDFNDGRPNCAQEWDPRWI